MKAFCVMLLAGCALSSCAGSAAGQAEHNTGEHKTNDRKLITHIEADYPETLLRLNIGGTVRLEVTISAKGNVEGATLLGGSPILGQSAMVAVKKWKYAPAPSRTVTEVRITFDPHR